MTGVFGVDVSTYQVVVKDRVVDTLYNYWEAQDILANALECEGKGTDIDPYQGWPIDDIPDSYWKNGHIAPLQVDNVEHIPFDGTIPTPDNDDFTTGLAPGVDY